MRYRTPCLEKRRMRKRKAKQPYSSVAECEGMEFKRITESVLKLGWRMNYSSARNWLLRAMMKMAKELTTENGQRLTEEQLRRIARSSSFQSAIGELVVKAHVSRPVDTYDHGVGSKNVAGRAAEAPWGDGPELDDEGGAAELHRAA